MSALCNHPVAMRSATMDKAIEMRFSRRKGEREAGGGRSKSPDHRVSEPFSGLDRDAR